MINIKPGDIIQWLKGGSTWDNLKFKCISNIPGHFYTHEFVALQNSSFHEEGRKLYWDLQYITTNDVKIIRSVKKEHLPSWF